MKSIGKTIRLFIALTLLCLNAEVMHAQLERLIVETYYVAEDEDTTDMDGGKLERFSKCYRIYADLKPGSKVTKIYGSKYHPFIIKSTKHFFNNIDGQSFAEDIKKSKYNQNTVGLDTYLTIGKTASALAGKQYFGVLKRMDNDGSFVGGTNNDGGSAAIAGGMLKGKNAEAGLPLTSSDGIDTMNIVLPKAESFGVKDFLSGNDSTIFGSLVKKKEYTSRNMFLSSAGAMGVDRDSNYVLLAQLTTAGSFSFEFNLEVVTTLNGLTTTTKYVANDSLLASGEVKNRYLKYPFAAAICGCTDANYYEYDSKAECSNNALYCKKKIIFGCTDTMACNFDANANFNLAQLCCYPGACQGRDIASVCPKVRGNNYSFSLQPNPTDGRLNLNFLSGEALPMSFILHDYSGSIVMQKDFGTVSELTNYQIELDNLEKGLYYFELFYGSNSERKLILFQ